MIRKLQQIPALFFILLISASFAVSGISYGLPMHVVGDEESIVGGALKMLETHTLVPATRPEVFSFLYYPVLLPYSILIFSSPVIVYQLAAHDFSLVATQDYFALHQEELWLAARMVTVVSALLMLWLTYRLAGLFYNRRVAFFAAALLATSFYHVNLSHWIKHWIPATLAAYATFYLIARYVRKQNVRIYAPGIMAALAMGVSYVTVFGHAMGALYVLFERKIISKDFWKFVRVNLFVFLILTAALLTLNYPDLLSQFGQKGYASGTQKSFFDMLSMMVAAFLILLRQEPVILFSSVCALIFVRGYTRHNSYIFFCFLSYLVALYIFYHFEPRYIYFLIPALAIAGASFFDRVCDLLPKHALGYCFFALTLVYPLTIAIRYDWLLTMPDTRSLAQQWIADNIGDAEFVISSRSMMLYRSREALSRELQHGSIRAPERYLLDHYDRVFALVETSANYTNLHFWKLESSLDDLDNYLDTYRPKYFVVEYWNEAALSGKERSMMARGALISEFRQSNTDTYDISGNVYASLSVLFGMQRPGPTIQVYSL